MSVRSRSYKIIVQRDSNALTTRVIELLDSEQKIYEARDEAVAAADRADAAAESVSGAGGIIDQAQAATDAANQAASDANSVIDSFRFTSRQSLANYLDTTSATFGDGTEFRAGGISYVWQQGATSIPDMPNVLPLHFTSPEHYGAVGNGTTNDAAAIQAMFNGISPSGVRVVWFNPNREYGVGTPILTTASFQCFTRMRFVGLGNRPAYSDTLINFNANVTIDSIEVRLAAGATWQRVLRPGRGYIGRIVVTAPARISGYEDAAGAAVTFSIDNNTYVRVLRVENFDYTASVRLTNWLNIERLETIGSVRGVRFSQSEWLSIGSHVHNGRRVPFAEASGSYAQDIEDVKNFWCGEADVKDTVSHGIRLSGTSDYSTQFLSWGTVNIHGAGRCGLKIQGATNDTGDGTGGPPTWISDISIADLTVNDAGKLCDEYLVANNGVGEFSDNGTGAPGGANEYGLSLIKCRRVNIKFKNRKVYNTYAGGSAGLSIRSCKDLNIEVDIDSAYYYGIKFGAGEESLDSIHIRGNITRIGTFTDNTTNSPGTAANSRGHGVWAWAGSVTVMNDWLMDLVLVDCRRAFYHRATSFPRTSVLQGVMARNFSGMDDGAPASNQYLNLMTTHSART